MAYTLEVNTNTTGDNFAAAISSTDKLTEHTKKIDEALKAYLATHDKLIKSHETEAGRQAQIAALKEKYWDQETAQLRKIAAAQDAAAKEAEKRANAETKAADEAGAALRKLAAAQDAANAENKKRNDEWTNGLLISGAAAAAMGAWMVKNAADTAKYAQEISNLALRTGMTTTETQLYARAADVAGVNAGTLTTAMRTLSRGLSENTDEGRKQKEVLKELGVTGAAAYKPMGDLLPELFQRLSSVTSEIEKERMTITLFGRSGLELLPLMGRFSEFEARVKATGVVMDESGVEKAKAYAEELNLLGLQWDALKQKLGIDAIGVIRFIINPFQKTPAAPKSLAEQNKGTPTHWWDLIGADLGPGGYGASTEVAPNVLGGRLPGSQFVPTPGGPPTAQMQAEIGASRLLAYNLAHQDPKARIQEELSRLGPERKGAEDRYKGAEPGSANSIAALADLERIDKRTKALHDQEQAIKDQVKATAELRAEEKALDEEKKASMERQFNDPIAKAIIKGRFGVLQHPTLAAQFAPLYQQDIASAADVELRKASGQVIAGIEANPGEQAKVFLKLLQQEIKAGTKELAEMSKTMTDAREGALRVEEGTLKNLQDTGRRTLSQFAIRNQLAGGGEGAAISGRYGIEASQAQAQYEQELKIADLHKGEAVEEGMRVKALADLKQKLYDADMERENALLEVALRQKEAFQSTAVGLFNAAKSGQIPSFLKGQLGKLEDTVVGNAAGMAWKGIGGLIPHAQDPNSTLGKLLQGTPFGPDPTKALATVTIDNTAATRANTAALNARGSGGGGSGASVPGTGGGSGPAGVSETDTPTYGLPTDGAGNGDYGGEAGPAVPVPSLNGMSALGKGIGIAGAGAAGVFGIYSGLHAGGAQGGLEAGASAAAAAGAIASIANASSALGPIGMAVGVGLGLVATLLGDPKQNRRDQIASELERNQFMAPVAIHASMTTGGAYSDFDRFGAPRGSGLSPFPQVTQGFFDYRHGGFPVPGVTNSQFGGGATPASVTVQVQTLDSRSFNENSALVAGALQHALQTGRATGLQETLRSL